MPVFYWPFHWLRNENVPANSDSDIDLPSQKQQQQDTSKLFVCDIWLLPYSTHTTTQLTSSHEDTREKGSRPKQREEAAQIYRAYNATRDQTNQTTTLCAFETVFRPLSDPSVDKVFALGTCILVFLLN
jgi:hypothetical protein